MNDAPSTSNHATNDDPFNDHTTSSTTGTDSNGDFVRQKGRAQRDRKAAFLDHLIRNIDIVIYCHLSILYYMDCSFVKFLVRALPHWFYFTPKPAIFPPPPLAHRPYVGIIFGTNIICMLFHLIFAPPAAGEATRGYLHGGLVIDFIGQESPVGKWRLVVLDITILALQVLVLGVTLERRGIKSTDEVVNGLAHVEIGGASRQNHDFEERGLIRQDADTRDNVELQDLQYSSAGRTGGEEDRERNELMSPDGTGQPYNQHALDSFYAGGYVVASLHILDTIRAQWQAIGVSAEGSDAAVASGVQAATVAMAGRTFTYRLGEGIRRTV